jgi:squalene-hopene/tetraprenyl-beta-curcumene cyclase
MRFVGQALWAPSVLPAAFPACRDRLTRRLLARVGPDGALRDPCRSRVPETALMLALIEFVGCAYHFADERRRLIDYLNSAAHRRESGDSRDSTWDVAFTAAALGSSPPIACERLANEFLSHAPSFTSPRKRMLWHALFAMLGASAVPAPNVDASAFGNLHPWAAVQVAAARVVLASADARGSLADDIALLRSTQNTVRGPGDVWESNLLLHLLTLHALARVPGHADLVVRGIRTALRRQRIDGGIPFVTDTDTWSTVVAGLALHTAGVPATVLRPVAAHVASVQHADGGWSYTDRALLPDTDCTTVAVEFLHQVDPRAHKQAIDRAVRYLVAAQGPDGGFPTYGAGSPSEPCMTAAAINALTTQTVPHHREALDHAVGFLAAGQHPDGSFPAGWSSSRVHALFRVHLAMRSLSLSTGGPVARGLGDPARAIDERIIRLLLRSQNSDGGWGRQEADPSDVISTAYGLIVAAGGVPEPGPAARAASYLVARQRDDGGFDASPDMLGPRPLPYHVPLLTDAFVLLALGHLTRRIAAARGTVAGPRRRLPADRNR